MSVKESLGEYGSGWEWENVWPMVFDNEMLSSLANEFGNISAGYYPTRYDNTTSKAKPTIIDTWVNYGIDSASIASTVRCPVESTNGEMLVSGSVMNSQQSCESHAYNMGNYYNLSSQLGDARYNSVCSKGWTLPGINDKKSFSTLLVAYGINHNEEEKKAVPNDVALLNMPLSYLRSGYYVNNGIKYGQGSIGYYRMSSLSLGFSFDYLFPTYGTVTNFGFSIRCVSR